MNKNLKLGFLLVVLVACTRNMNGTSKISFQPPNSAQNSSLAALPSNQNACYGINISGGALDATANQCSPALGLIAGFIGSGQSISVDVPKGSGYTIDLYLYLMDVGDTGPCPQFSKPLAAMDLNHVYHVGTATNINLVQDEETVTITSNFPGLGQTIAAQFPNSCTSGMANAPYRISTGAGIAINGTHQLKSHFGRPTDGQVLSNASFKIITNK